MLSAPLLNMSEMSNLETGSSPSDDANVALKPGDGHKPAVTPADEPRGHETSLEKESEPDSSSVSTVRKFAEEFVFGEAEGLRKWCCERGPVFVVISSILRGVGQVCFMDNPWTGLIMISGLLSFNPYYGLLGLIGGATNLCTATVLLGTEYLSLPSSNYLNNGIFVYNGLLVGLMCGTFVHGMATEDDDAYVVFLKLVPCSMAFSYLCSSIHVGMTNMFPSFPVFTFPFNLAGFLWLPVSVQIMWIHSTLSPHFAADAAVGGIDSVYSSDDLNWGSLLFEGIFRGPVQIYLCSDEWVGIAFIVAIAICNWRAAALCLWGCTVGTLFAVLIGVDVGRISFGLHSYNSALTMMGVGCIFAKFNAKNLAMAVLHSCFCVLLELAAMTVMAPSDMPYLTLPFCLSTMFFAVFAFRVKQEEQRKTRRKESEQRGDLLSKTMSIRGAPIKLDDVAGTDPTGDAPGNEKREEPEKRGAPILLDSGVMGNGQSAV